MRVLFFGNQKPVTSRCLTHLQTQDTVHVVPPEEIQAAAVCPPEHGIADDYDLVVSVLCREKIPARLIRCGKVALNFHPAPLPALRGVGGINVAILEGWTWFAVTCHHLVGTIDAGPIVAQWAFDIDPACETAQSLELITHGRLYDCFRSVIRRLRAGEMLPAMPQSGAMLGGSSMVRTIRRADLEVMRQVPATANPERIERTSRAFWYPPHAGASIQGQPWTLVTPEMLKMLG